MSTSENYLVENRASLQRLRALVERLNDDDLMRVLPSGWTVSDTLGHLSFYDRRAAYLLGRFATEGVFDSAGDVDTINDVLVYLTRRIPARAMADEAIAAAEAANQAVGALPESLKNDPALGDVVRLSRAEHRDEHVEEITATLA
jgi:Mycothiol maleylpyruvate isomerase N-terminal domain